jgi:hypothetical protein
MTCHGCSDPITEDQHLSEMPCCDLVMHSKCALKRIGDTAYNAENVYCPGCFAPLWERTQDEPTEPPVEFYNEAPMYKKIFCEYKKSLSSLNRMIREQKAAFKEVAQPHIDAIKDFQKQTLDTIKATDEFKATKKEYARTIRTIDTIRQKYNLRRYFITDHFKVRGLYMTPLIRIRRMLRVKA